MTSLLHAFLGESLACAHLGAVKQRADAATAKACTERRLLLARTLGDNHGKGDAYLQASHRLPTRLAPHREPACFYLIALGRCGVSE